MLATSILHVLTVSAALALSIEAHAASGAIDLEAVIRNFAAMPGLSARFREEKQMTLLQIPLVSEGRLYFAPPDRIARHVERPAPSTLIVRNDEVVIGTAGEQHTLDLTTQPVMRSFVDAFRLILAGDLARLRERYAIEFHAGGANRAWQITLLPRDPRLAAVIRSIEIAGRDAILLELRIFEADGDTAVTRFTDVDRNRRFSDVERDALFRIPP